MVATDVRHSLPLDSLELRTAHGKTEIRGYAAVFDSLSDDLGGFQEVVAPGAFTDTLAADADVRALVDHNSSLILGRTRAKTLALKEDRRGLRVNIQPPDTTAASDLLESMRRGDVSQMSFAFRVVDDEWDFTRKVPLRTLRAVELFDVSVVTFPAYAATSATVEGRTKESKSVFAEALRKRHEAQTEYNTRRSL